MISRNPRKAKPEIQSQQAWWYENKGSIEVCVYSEDNGTMSCKIPRRDLLDWINRTAKGRHER